MEKNRWAYRAIDNVLNRVSENRNCLLTIKPRKSNRIGHILCSNCLLKQVVEGRTKGRIDVKGRRERRRKKLVDDLKKTRRW